MCYKIDIAHMYGIDPRTLNARISETDLQKLLPKLSKKKAIFYPDDLKIIESKLGMMQGWRNRN